MTDGIELSIVMPCLNEAATLAGCIEKARIGIERSGVRDEISLSYKAVSTTCPYSPVVSIELLAEGVRVLRENGSLLLIEPGFLSAGS